MLSNNNNQKASGNTNSKIIQVNGDFYEGISEERARLICRKECQRVLQEWSFEAGLLVEKRVQKLEDKVLPKMIEQDESLKIFGDPSFQMLIRKAQISAACTEREADYDMLAELLLHSSEQNDNRERRVGITKAVEIVDQIEGKALVGMSVIYALSNYVPLSDNPNIALTSLDSIYKKLIDKSELPSGTSWMEHLDLLSAVRIGVKGLNSFKNLTDFIPERLSKFFYLGLASDDERLMDLKDRFLTNNLPISCFVEHDFKNGYEKLNLYDDIDNIRIIRNGERIQLSVEQKELMSEAKRLMHVDGQNDPELKATFWELWDKYPTLKEIKSWLSSLPVSFSYTQVGKALSNAYIHGKDSSLPYLY